jgi:hypothetical protein
MLPLVSIITTDGDRHGLFSKIVDAHRLHVVEDLEVLWHEIRHERFSASVTVT